MSRPPPPFSAYTAPVQSVKRMSRSGSSHYAANNNEAQLVSPLSEYPIKRQRINTSPYVDQQPTSIQPQKTFTLPAFTHSSASLVSTCNIIVYL